METIQDLLGPFDDNVSMMEEPLTGHVSLPGDSLVKMKSFSPSRMVYLNKCSESSPPMKIEMFSEDVLENIFSRISLKSRTRSKCVSKSWCTFLTRLRKSLPQTPFTLVLESCPFANIEFETLFSATLLSFRDEGTKCSLSTSFQLPNTLERPRVLSSCNGLLLYVKRTESCYWEMFEYLYIVNPSLHQCRVLPPQTNDHLICERQYWFVGMSFTEQPHFKVVLNTDGIKAGDKMAIFYIFESHTWEWKKHYATIISNVPRQLISSNKEFCSFSWKEKIYVLYHGYIALYNVEQGVLKFVKLPHEYGYPHGDVCDVESEILWVSEGILYYCLSSKDWVFHLLSYDDVNDNWWSKMKFPREGNKLKLRHMDLAIHQINLIAFNEDLQILYLRLCNIIVAYSFETRRLRKVWGEIFQVDNTLLTWSRAHPFVFNPVSLFNGT